MKLVGNSFILNEGLQTQDGCQSYQKFSATKLLLLHHQQFLNKWNV